MTQQQRENRLRSLVSRLSVDCMRLSWWMILVCLVGCDSESPCDLETSQRAFSSATARDCGYVALGADAALVDACVKKSHAEGVPFFASYQRQGIDSEVRTGIAMNEVGEFSILTWDAFAFTSKSSSVRITRQVCIGPTLNLDASERDLGWEPVSCTSTSSSEQVCESSSDR